MEDGFGPILDAAYWGEYQPAPISKRSFFLSEMNTPEYRLRRSGRAMGRAVLDILAGADTQPLNQGVIINPSPDSVAPFELPGAIIAIDEELLRVTGLPSGEDPFLEQDEDMLTMWQLVSREVRTQHDLPVIRSIGSQSISEFLIEAAVKRTKTQDISEGFMLRTDHLAGKIIRPGLVYRRGVRIVSIIEGWPVKKPYLTNLYRLKFDGDERMKTDAMLASQALKLEGSGGGNSLVDALGSVAYSSLPMVVGETMQYLSETSSRYTLRRIVRAEVLKNGTRLKTPAQQLVINQQLA